MWRIGLRGAAGSRLARIAVGVVAAALLFTLIGSTLPSGLGSPPVYASSLSKSKADLAEAKKKLKALQTKLDKLAKQQSEAEADLEVTQDKVVEVQSRIDDAEDELAGLREQLSGRLAEMYKNRSSDTSTLLNVLFAGDDASLTTVVERLALVAHIAQSDTRLVNKVVDRVAQLKEFRADIRAQKRAEAGKKAKYEAAREKTLASLENAKDDYNALKKKVARLQEEARRAEIAAQKAEAARKAALAAANAERKTTGSSVRENTGTTARKNTGTTARKTTTTTERETSTPVIADFVFPVDGPNSFSNTFGAPRSGGRTHKGCDIFTARNTPLVACVDGTITSTSPTNTGLGGITIHLRKGNTTYYYAHLSSLKSGIRAGVRVGAGEVIGYAGNTGNASGGAVHLHFEIRPNGVAIDPYPILVKYR